LKQANSKENERDNTLSFLHLADALKIYHDKCGIPFKPYDDPRLPHFSKLPVAGQNLVLTSVGTMLNLYAEMENHGERPNDSSRLLWRSLSRLGWRPMSDIFDKIESDDVIEIYSDTNVQIFRNMNFFRYISITLEEMCVYPWYQIAQMDTVASDYYATLAPKMKNNTITESFRTPIPKYYAKELMGEKNVLEITPRWISPVYVGPQCVGIISLIKSRFA
jgi:hypothetical protein